ncbi:methyltransferase domain-containing protein [Paenibacillus rhizoplanae]
MSSRISNIRRQFNRSANSYDAHAQVQRIMSDRLAGSFIGWKNKGNVAGLNILEIGCGTGALTEILINEWPSASITALDIAPAMIKLAEQRVLSAEANIIGKKLHRIVYAFCMLMLKCGRQKLRQPRLISSSPTPAFNG